jgi:hypothetical protein
MHPIPTAETLVQQFFIPSRKGTVVMLLKGKWVERTCVVFQEILTKVKDLQIKIPCTN